MTDEVVDAEAIEERPPERHPVVQVATLAVAPQVKPAELVSRLDAIREAAESAMDEGVDYGVIPGTNKPTLFKPGAEKLAVLFQLDVQLRNETIWGPGEHLTVVSHATVYHAPTESRLGYGEGVCTTRERKYAKRKLERVCPECDAPAVIKGKKEYGGGWLCWKKRDGCGAKFPDGAEAIESQETGEIDNPDLPDLWNTVVKMAEKRARVDAVLAVTGASALFTQDLEDTATAAAETTQAEPAAEEKITARQMAGHILKAKREVSMSDDRFAALLTDFGVTKLEDLPRSRVKALHTAITGEQADVAPDMDGLPTDGDPGPEEPLG